jgi:hypothetical protein
MDVAGFRRLRTVSQLTFETLPQILLQIRIYSVVKNRQDVNSLGDISVSAIILSICLGVLHLLIESLLIYQEKMANKTSFLHYILISFNGKFGYVPFTGIFTKD